MKISIVTAVRNRLETVTESITSVQNQTWSEREHIIQDGCSTDGTLEIIRQLADERTYIISARDTGIYNAINLGISRSSGEIIGLMHSDDSFAHSHVLEKIAKAFEDPAIDGVYGDLDYVSASDQNRVIRHWKSGGYRPEILKRGWMPPHPTLYLRRRIFEEWGLYDTDYHISADYDAMLRYLAKGKIRLSYIPEVLVKMRVGGESNRSLGRIWLKSREDYKALRHNGVGGVGALVWKNVSKLGQFF